MNAKLPAKRFLIIMCAILLGMACVWPLDSAIPTLLAGITPTPAVEASEKAAVPPISQPKGALMEESGKLVISDFGGNILAEISTGIYGGISLEWSPNGRYLLATAVPDTEGTRVLVYLIDTDTKSVYQWPDPLRSGEFLLPGSWAPTSDRLTILTQTGLSTQVDVVSALGTRRRILYQGWFVNGGPAWSPDGHYLAAAARHEGIASPMRLYLINADTGDIKDITPAGVESAGFFREWREDGTLVFGGATGPGQPNRYRVLDLSTGSSRLLRSGPVTDDISGAANCPARAMLAFVVGQHDGSEYLFVENQLTGVRGQVWQTSRSVDMNPFSWSPSCEWLDFITWPRDDVHASQEYLVDVDKNIAIPLPGELHTLLQGPRSFADDGGWIDDNTFVLTHAIGQDGQRFMLADTTGTELRELCTASISKGPSCALWAP